LIKRTRGAAPNESKQSDYQLQESVWHGVNYSYDEVKERFWGWGFADWQGQVGRMRIGSTTTIESF